MNYRESAVTGSKWTRSQSVTVSNPLSGVPEIAFSEEEVSLLSDGRAINNPVGVLRKVFDTPATTFPLLNPVDNTVIGTASHQEVYILLHSLYMALAAERDAEG
jgi:hypothetical protein